jgi:DNA-binding NarL/FixJ family response regulator
LEAQQANAEKATRLAHESLAIARQTGDLFGTVISLHNLAMVAGLRRDLATQRSVTEEGLIATRNWRNPWWISVFLEHAGFAALAQQHHEAAIQLAAAATHLRRSVRGVISPVWVAVVEQFVLTPARFAVGESVAAAAWTTGERMPLDQAIGNAMKQTVVLTIESSAAPEKVSPLSLSKRELAVAALVAEGLSNKQIAAGLFVSKRTVETHIQHIFSKLGVESRASIAAWAVGQRLVTPRSAPTSSFVR